MKSPSGSGCVVFVGVACADCDREAMDSPVPRATMPFRNLRRCALSFIAGSLLFFVGRVPTGPLRSGSAGSGGPDAYDYVSGPKFLRILALDLAGNGSGYLSSNLYDQETVSPDPHE